MGLALKSGICARGSLAARDRLAMHVQISTVRPSDNPRNPSLSSIVVPSSKRIAIVRLSHNSREDMDWHEHRLWNGQAGEPVHWLERLEAVASLGPSDSIKDAGRMSRAVKRAGDSPPKKMHTGALLI